MRPSRGGLAHDDRGVTMTELLVSMTLLVAVMAAVATALVSSNRLFAYVEDDAVGSLDVRTAVERLGRDVRNARGLDAGATRGTLQLWIDANSDYQRQPSEVVRWTIVPRGSHFDVGRQVGSGPVTTQASTVVSDIAFCYRTAASGSCVNPTDTPVDAATAEKVLSVQTTMTYDPRLTSGAGQRSVTFIERLRNVG